MDDADMIASMTRREFIILSGITLATAGGPLEAVAALVASPSTSFGGPTPNDKFYITSYGGTPAVDANIWRLRITGLVKQPIILSYQDIRAMTPVRETLTLECISNPPNGDAISNANWTGVKLAPILERAGVKGKAVYAAMRGADGYYTGVAVDEIMRKENFLPYLMNGVPLPPAHGFPVRIFIPGKYGQKQPKWLTEIRFVDSKFIGYWEGRGWSNSAWRKVNSGFFSPRLPGSFFDIFERAVPAKAPVDIVGWALAGPSGIRRVQVSTDDGKSWHDASRASNATAYVWTIWKYRFEPAAPGDFQVRVRATSGDGVTQPVSDPQRGSGMSGQPTMTLRITAV
ncbi:MAG TPA: molybdopterin-dependent oxidoreductase [Candidatus Binataceae bacterium]|nr:molybdopterin-dependent oxidoreductase [Candidatus Binataceae bacterium]